MEKARMAIYSIAGIYLLYLAYNLVGGVSKTEGTEKIFSIIFAIVFVGIGITLTVVGVYKSYKLKKDVNPKEIETEEKDTEKKDTEEKEKQ